MKDMRNKRKEEIKERKKRKELMKERKKEMKERKKEMKENRRNEGRVGGNQKLNLCMGIKLNLSKKNLHHKSK